MNSCFLSSLDLILSEVPAVTTLQSPEHQDVEKQPEESTGLFSEYRKRRKQDTASSPETQFNNYLLAFVVDRLVSLFGMQIGMSFLHFFQLQ